MASSRIETPRDKDLGLASITNSAGIAISILPNGSIFAIEHRSGVSRILINQILGQPIHGGIGRIILRVGGSAPFVTQIVGPEARVSIGKGERSLVWDGSTEGVHHRVSLELHESEPGWIWRVELTSHHGTDMPCDVILVQDIGLGDRGFVMGSEAYVSQYVDHHIEDHPSYGPVIMCRQAQPQGRRYPWIAIGAASTAVSFATDALQVLGPAYRDSGAFPLAFGQDLPGKRVQHEVACPMLQSRVATLSPGVKSRVTFFALFAADHPEASSAKDLDRLGSIANWTASKAELGLDLHAPARSVVQDAAFLAVETLDETDLACFGEARRLEERSGGELLSFFAPQSAHDRHVAMRAKERRLPRRHGAMLRSGQSMMLDDATLCATHWMHGVFAAQLTIGNTSFHKLFSVSRDPYNLTWASGLRMMVDLGEGWRLLAVPSAFDIGLTDCRWLYRLAGRAITVQAIAAGDAPAMVWRVRVEGPACQFLVFGHVVLGEREFEDGGTVEIDAARSRITMRPSPDSLWGRTCPNATYHLVTGMPEAFEAIGGDELLHNDGIGRGGPYIALRSRSVTALSFAVVGSMTDPAQSEALAQRFCSGVDDEALLAPARRYWSYVTREARLEGQGAHLEAQSALLPWLAHNAMIHLTVPHGLEQYTGAAWGTRDVCQGPVEFLLTMEHDKTVRDILQVVFSEQSETRADWPQWFMLEPYPQIRAGSSHGDVIIWPLKALCDYIEETGDFSILDERLPWRRDGDLGRTRAVSTIAEHVDRLLAEVEARFIPGTRLIRYGEGDWNDSLQPVDPSWPDWMVSSWTVALLYEQLNRYADILIRRGNPEPASTLQDLAESMRADVNRHLIRDGVIAGYGLFGEDGGVELLLHPSDQMTGITLSLIPMTQAILGSLFTPEQTDRHLHLIADRLLFPDGVRLMDKPVRYHGGVEKLFRRAESAAYFGREIGLMYVHAHLRYCEALAKHGDADALWHQLALINPILVTDILSNASPRQSNAYFSSSDAAYPDRYKASAEWERVGSGTIAVDGGWRIYSSGPGLYTNVLLRHAFGRRRNYGKRVGAPVLPKSLGNATFVMNGS